MQVIKIIQGAALLILGIAPAIGIAQAFTLNDYYSNNELLEERVEATYEALSEEERVAQMIVTSLGRLGKPYEQVEPLIQERKVGGIIFLSGDPEQFKEDIASIQSMSEGFPLLMSMDAEPSLFNRRMPGTPEMPPTNTLQSTEAIESAVQTINATLKEIGFHQNYAPVVDVSPNNEAIGNRTMGGDSATIVPLAKAFIQKTQQDQIIATAKHFPGHGRVQGDTHKKLVFIDGNLTEKDIYKPMIDAGVISVMVGHIAIENNAQYQTEGMPSTLSPVVVNELLRKEMGFEGIIITDAMNMGAVAEIPQSTLLAAKAGCDIILMPPNEERTLDSIISAAQEDPDFAAQVEQSVKRVLRAKLCLGLRFE